jgi:outer membrane protein OmpA-like peptidoglycan-associated protein
VDVCPNTPAGADVDANGCPIDSDEDGVFDGLDQCPNTPRGATVDPNGCPSDTDGDSVFDGIDQCPNTPPGSAVDQRGCPVDDDGDGVLNTQDQCPGTPPGTEVDARGCTIERDIDGDGVPDNRDRCPNTAAGQEVDEIGCPILFQVEQGQVRRLVLRGVAFETGRSALTQDSYGILDQIAERLVARPDVRIEVAGHTDNTGSRSLNMRLSLERAQAVKAYLARKGVEPSRMVSAGYGPDQPIATNATAAGRAQNRRVELKRLDQPGS